MANEADQIIDDSSRLLVEMFSRLHLTADEELFVNMAAKQLKDTAFSLLEAVPEDKRKQMRGIVTALAIAMIVGPWRVADQGIGGFGNET